MNTNIVTSFEDSISLAINQIFVGMINFLPTLLGAFVLLVVGLLLAGWARSAVVKIVKISKLDSLFKNPAIKDFLENAQIGEKIEEILGEIVRWIIIALFFMASMNILGLTPVINFLNSIFAYLPNLFAAVVILLIGAILAGFLEKMVKGFVGGYDISMSRFMGKFVSYAVMVISVLTAIRQLNIAQSFIDALLYGFVATFVIALGLGLGLGSKDLIKNILEDWYQDFKKRNN